MQGVSSVEGTLFLRPAKQSIVRAGGKNEQIRREV